MTPISFPHHIIPLISYSINMNAITVPGQHTIYNSIYLHNDQSWPYNKLKQLINVHLGNINTIKSWTIIHLLQPQKIIKYQIKTIWFKLIPVITLKQLHVLYRHQTAITWYAIHYYQTTTIWCIPLSWHFPRKNELWRSLCDLVCTSRQASHQKRFHMALPSVHLLTNKFHLNTHQIRQTSSWALKSAGTQL